VAVTYYVALPFIRTEDGTAPGEAQECQSEGTAIRRAEGMSRDPVNAGAVSPPTGFRSSTSGGLWTCARTVRRVLIEASWRYLAA
jgi:hypothetical protein